jgi:hypothetical protein
MKFTDQDVMVQWDFMRWFEALLDSRDEEIAELKAENEKLRKDKPSQ